MREHQHGNISVATVNVTPQHVRRIHLVDTEIRMLTDEGTLVAAYDLCTFVNGVLEAHSRRRKCGDTFDLEPHLKSIAPEDWFVRCIVTPPDTDSRPFGIQLRIEGLDWIAFIEDYQTLIITNGRLRSDPDCRELYKSQTISHYGRDFEVMYDLYPVTGFSEPGDDLQICKNGHKEAVAWITNGGEMEFDLVGDETWKRVENEKRSRAKQLLFTGLAVLQLLADRKRAPRTGR
ncbi:hypothetical protein DFH06DRAFT_1386651 [Mycena polygramma]|nr:hypothetical protein DFH06DRAFT_1386651 [Mycena polygramma]